MSAFLLEQAADHLGSLTDEVVFVGASAVAYWIEQRERLHPRVTKDVDCVIEATTKSAYDRFGSRLRGRGFEVDSSSRVIVRWVHQESGLVMDVMPMSERVFGFGGGWQAAAIKPAQRVVLGNQRSVRIATTAYLMAMKLAAYADRGRGDLLASHDFEDVILMLAALDDIVDEIAFSPADLRSFVSESLRAAAENPRFDYAFIGALNGYEIADSLAEDARRRYTALAEL